MKPKLVVPEEWKKLSAPGKFYAWNWTLIKMIATSGYFDVTEKKFPFVRVPGARNAEWCMFEVEGKTVGLDCWDTFSPSDSHLKEGFYKKDGILGNVDLLIKIQYFQHEFWDNFIKETGKPVTAWTIFPTHHFPLGHFKWKPDGHKYLATCTGKMGRFGRQPWVDFCNKNPDFYAKDTYNGTDDHKIYLDLMKDTKWGLSLKGKWCAVKNRRESEYSSCGIPLALNYKPTYPFTMNAGEHYFYLEKPDDLANLRDVNPVPFAQASEYLYNEYFSPYGMSKLLHKLVSELT